jgi:hypothetical protein
MVRGKLEKDEGVEGMSFELAREIELGTFWRDERDELKVKVITLRQTLEKIQSMIGTVNLPYISDRTFIDKAMEETR